MELEGFDWGWMDIPTDDFHQDDDGTYISLPLYHKRCIIREIFEKKLYELHSTVKEGDIVLDVGASIGPFTYSILDKNPSKVVCIEPSPKEHSTLEKNVLRDNVTIIKKAIGSSNEKISLTNIFGIKDSFDVDAITFKTLIKENNIEKIDFLKTDCEGGEYDIFTIDNFCWLKENLGAAVGEWHLSTPELKQKFKEFRDVFLRLFPNHEVYSIDGANIKWDLWNEHFMEYYNEVIIYINNKK